MSLRDATAFNMQFRRGRPALMDTSSFEVYDEGRPWPAIASSASTSWRRCC